MTVIQRILCPTDFSDSSEAAVRYSVSLAESFPGASVHLLHVDTLPTYGLPQGSILDDEHRAELRRQLADLTRRYSAHDVELHKEMVSGVAWKEILAYADKLEADLIVIATHGRTGIKRLLIGSVAERVVRLSTIPVLTVRAEGP